MERATLVRILVSIGSMAGFAAGCGQAAQSGPSAAENLNSTALAEVTFEPGHVVKFQQAQAGFVFVAETGSVAGGAPRMKNPALAGKSPVEIYQLLAPGMPVPPALATAQASQAPAAAVPYTPTDVAGHGTGPDFYTAAEQASFAANYCPGAQKCVQAWDWIDSGWDYTTQWQAVSMIGSEGTAVVPFDGQYWNCSGGSCVWTTFYSMMLSPGWYGWIWGTGLYYYKGTLSGAGGGTQISMAITDAPYECAHCNDGSCQCGYMDANDLCSAHKGNNPNVGCSQ